MYQSFSFAGYWKYERKQHKLISKILEYFITNQLNISEQLKNQYTVKGNVIKQFNHTIETIEPNEFEIKSNVIVLVNKDTEYIQMGFGNSSFNQLGFLYNSILSIVTDIGKPITFCKLDRCLSSQDH